jgi:flagellar basal-body rod modification protein FlgD
LLLTTQLQNQDPLNPMSNEEFVAQLAQFSSLEKLGGISDGLESLYLVNVSMNNAAMSGLVGQDAVARSEQFHYDGEGEQSVAYDASSAAASATITLTDEDGNVVYSGEMGALAAGEGRWTWNGTTTDGRQAPEGIYTATITARDANGATVEVTGLVEGTVTEMDYSDGTARPSIDGVTVDIGDIVRLAESGDDE